jgi:hypothetical protein
MSKTSVARMASTTSAKCLPRLGSARQVSPFSSPRMLALDAVARAQLTDPSVSLSGPSSW